MHTHLVGVGVGRVGIAVGCVDLDVDVVLGRTDQVVVDVEGEG